MKTFYWLDVETGVERIALADVWRDPALLELRSLAFNRITEEVSFQFSRPIGLIIPNSTRTISYDVGPVVGVDEQPVVPYDAVQQTTIYNTARLRAGYRAFASYTARSQPRLPDPNTFVVAPAETIPGYWGRYSWFGTGSGIMALAPDGRTETLTIADGRVATRNAGGTRNDSDSTK